MFTTFVHWLVGRKFAQFYMHHQHSTWHISAANGCVLRVRNFPHDANGKICEKYWGLAVSKTALVDGGCTTCRKKRKQWHTGRPETNQQANCRQSSRKFSFHTSWAKFMPSPGVRGHFMLLMSNLESSKWAKDSCCSFAACCDCRLHTKVEVVAFKRFIMMPITNL